MKRTSFILITLVAAAILAACGAPAGNTVMNAGNANSNANSNANAAKPAAAAPSKESLMTMEKAAWEAWKNRDAKWMTENASDKYVGFSNGMRVDKAASVKSYEQKCEIKSYALTEDNLQMVGNDLAVLTMRGTQDYTCDGKKGPGDVRATSMYVREGDKWKAAFYAETATVDPKAPPNPATAKKEEAKKEEAKADAATEALVAAETKNWEAWKKKDAKALDAHLAKEYGFLSGTGHMDRAATIKAWAADNKCEVKSYWLSDAQSVSLTPTVSLLTFKGGGDGTCEGQPIATEWYVGAYTKEGDAWKPAFGMGISQ
jgi:hypothetical protein